MRHTITGNNEELVVIGQLMDCHIGECGHNLLLGGQLGALLELEVTNGTGQGEIAIDTSEVDEATRGANTCLLAYGVGISKALEGNDQGKKEGKKNKYSPSFCGLWSNERGFARPLTPSTDRESPALAYHRVSHRTSTGSFRPHTTQILFLEIMLVEAVQPDTSSSYFGSALVRKEIPPKSIRNPRHPTNLPE